MSVEKNDSMLDRLYTIDIKKRKEKQKLLMEIYTPSFMPNICNNYGSVKKMGNNKKNKHSSVDKNNNYNYYVHTNYDIGNNYETKYENKYENKKVNNIQHYEDDEDDDDDQYFYKNYFLKVNTKIKYKKLNSHKINYGDGGGGGELQTFEGENRTLIENALRDKLFKNKKQKLKIRKTRSVQM